MSKKSMLLTAGALAALVFTALPSIASAGEFLNTCSTAKTCEGTIKGGVATLEEDNGTAVECTEVDGNANATHNSSTGTVELTFKTCHQDGNPGITCTNIAGTSNITTNTLVSHNVYLEKLPTETPVGILLTGVNVTFTCAGGLIKKKVTGNIIGEYTNPECEKAKAGHNITFASKAPTGTQKWEQVTTAGPLFDLTMGADEPDTTTASLAVTVAIIWAAGTTLTLDCKATV